MSAAASRALSGLERLLHPLPPAVFFEQYWEKRPLLLKRNDPAFYSTLFSRRDVESWFEHVEKAPAKGASKLHAGQNAAAAASIQEVNDSVSAPCPPRPHRSAAAPHAICGFDPLCSCACAAWWMARRRSDEGSWVVAGSCAGR